MPDQRDELVARLVEALQRTGLGAISIRRLAQEAGTSQRMLIHHFGSSAAALVAVVESIETAQVEALASLPDDPTAALQDAWTRLSRPELWPAIRLFFECYARGAQGEEPFTHLVARDRDRWQRGSSGDPIAASLGRVIIRGLLLELVATGDRASAEAQFDHLVKLLK